MSIDTRVVTIKIPFSFQQSEVVFSDLQNEEKKSVGNSKKKKKKKERLKQLLTVLGLRSSGRNSLYVMNCNSAPTILLVSW